VQRLKNVIDAQYYVAMMHEKKQGVRRSNPTTAFKLYRKAAANGHAAAQLRIANIYAEGVIVPQDMQKAFKNYMGAAERNDPAAQYEIGRLYEVGIDQAICARSPSIHSCRRTLNEKKFSKNDMQTAVSWYRKAAKQTYAPAQYRLGTMYDDGRGVAKNHDKAREWYQLAADQGMVEARFKLERHRKGARASRDAIEAVLTSSQVDRGQTLARKLSRDIAAQ